jgi:hypothetical protein
MDGLMQINFHSQPDDDMTNPSKEEFVMSNLAKCKAFGWAKHLAGQSIWRICWMKWKVV